MKDHRDAINEELRGLISAVATINQICGIGSNENAIKKVLETSGKFWMHSTRLNWMVANYSSYPAVKAAYEAIAARCNTIELSISEYTETGQGYALWKVMSDAGIAISKDHFKNSPFANEIRALIIAVSNAHHAELTEAVATPGGDSNLP